MIGRTIRAFGVVVAVHSDAPDLFDLIDVQLPGFPADASSTPDISYRVKTRRDGGVAVLRERRSVASVPDVPAAASALVTDLQSALARRAAGYTFVHAGVVVVGGQALLLPGRSYAGKSTLVAALLRSGATYGSDEFAVIDRAGCVHAYDRRLALRRQGEVARVSASRIGGLVMTEAVPAGAVVFTEFRENGRLVLEPLTPGDVVLRLLQHCLGVRGRPVETMRMLRAVAQHASGFFSPRGDADVAAQDLMRLAAQGWHLSPAAPRG